ncbi:hypothetical protein K1T71_012562 [Dendrolimus kikuchii]|uniref:Uncharacterized protein n=1 Tax=Dendrolimus kikuchii TaxID=765133 RepID=A0ACC1CJN7_9NEOP|nr:hypothetical protein K1T71_014817 [Dendrolimus kikuchii]KAJ0171799.1 hypothetical protein K1T71_012562 [Dendrolimus kikuchii]
MDVLQQSIAQLSSKFAERMDNFEGELRKGSTSSPNIATLAADFSTFKSFVMGALHSLQDQFILLANSVDQIEMRSRRKILLFHGISEEKQEDTAAAVAKVVVNQVKQTAFQVTDIKRCYRMGKSMSSGGKPRPVLVKFTDIPVRNQVWFAKTNLKASGITVSEKQIGVSRCWTRDGVIYAVSTDGTRHRLDSVQDLANVCQDTVASDCVIPLNTAKESAVNAPKTRRIATKK